MRDEFGLKVNSRHRRAHRRAEKLLHNFRESYRRNWHLLHEAYDKPTDGSQEDEA
jgi:hypothetical protein